MIGQTCFDTGGSSRVKTRLTHQINKQNFPFVFSGDESNAEYDLVESGTIVPKRKTEKKLENNMNDFRNCIKKSDSGKSI